LIGGQFRCIDRPLRDEAFVIGQLIPTLQPAKAASRTGVFVYETLHPVFAFKPLQFNILEQY
jgi:hypothetical protein